MSSAPTTLNGGNTLHDDKAVVDVVLNGADNEKPNGVNGVDSPNVDSPTTPVSSSAIPDVKIDIDYQEQESDVRHEPIPVKIIEPVAMVQDASTQLLAETPVDLDSNPPAPHSATPPPQAPPQEDVSMIEENAPSTNGASVDVDMSGPTPTGSPNIPFDSSMSSVHTNGISCSESVVMEEDTKPPPAKRQRMYSDADKASRAIASATPPPASTPGASDGPTPAPPPTGTPPPPSASTISPPSPGASTFSTLQYRFCGSTIRQLKKNKDSGPFLRPVDPVALNVPHYPSIIKHPMDFTTIEHKLASSNPAKPDPNPQNPRYFNVDEFIADVRLIFTNCITFNGPDHPITAMGKRIEEVFDKQIKHMPPALEHKPPPPKKQATPPPPPPPVVAPLPKKTSAARRPSTSVPVIRRNEEGTTRPKREIHPPPPKDLPYADVPKKQRKVKRTKDDGTNEQLKFCGKILQELHRKQHYAIAHPFYEPVDWVKLEIPSYPKIVKKPMDLSTMRRKLDLHEYPNAHKFFDDFKLMIRNCFAFNPAGTPVNQAGIELQRLFDDKWKSLPPLHSVSDDDEEDEEEDEEDDRARAIAMMESQIETMRGSIAALKSKPKEKKKEKKKEKLPVASTSKTSKPPKVPSKKRSKKPIADDDVLTFEQKKDLSEAIGKLDGPKLEKVIQIIHEGVPEIRDSTDEIELEIDMLPAPVLTKLYNFVLRPLRTSAPKRSRPGKGTGTGGLKRKSMDEDVEAEKIRQLERRMALFDQGDSSAAPRAMARDEHSEHSSDSSSGSDSSGSDSE
ncbi:hypothetical protein EYR36_007206 [Pleurotus pulmonarius]|nr:hypothetical protein EYR36_007206 [Pleurotus pulmonarius]